jgi:hypothetical protein
LTACLTGSDSACSSDGGRTPVRLDWQAPHLGRVVRYFVYRFSFADDFAAPVDLPAASIATVESPEGSPRYFDSSAPLGTQLAYFVRAQFDDLSVSGVSNFATVTTPAPPAGPSVPVLAAPINFASIQQNNREIGCSLLPGADASRGRGFQIAFDWNDSSSVNGIAGYRIVATHIGASLPIVDTFVASSQFTYTSCNSFTDALTGWQWRVQAVDAFQNPSDWSPWADFQFAPCRLDDGVTPCRAPAPPSASGSVADPSGDVPGRDPTSLTGRWVGLAPDGLLFAPDSGLCELDVILTISQEGNFLTGTSRTPVRNAATGCVRQDFSSVNQGTGQILPSRLTGSVEGGTVSFNIVSPGFRNGIPMSVSAVVASGTFTAGRVVMNGQLFPSRTWGDVNNNSIPECDFLNSLANGECGAASSAPKNITLTATPELDPDLVSGTVVIQEDFVTLQARFAAGTFNQHTTVAQFALDTDQNAATGQQGTDSVCAADHGQIGVEYIVDFGSDAHGTRATVRPFTGPGCNAFGAATFTDIGSVIYRADGLDVAFPRSLIGNDEGLLNFKVISFRYLPENAPSVTVTSVLDRMTNTGQAPGVVVPQ